MAAPVALNDPGRGVAQLVEQRVSQPLAVIGYGGRQSNHRTTHRTLEHILAHPRCLGQSRVPGYLHFFPGRELVIADFGVEQLVQYFYQGVLLFRKVGVEFNCIGMTILWSRLFRERLNK